MRWRQVFARDVFAIDGVVLRRIAQFSRRPNCHGFPLDRMPSRSMMGSVTAQLNSGRLWIARATPPMTGAAVRAGASVDTSLQGTANGLGCVLGGFGSRSYIRCG